MQGNLVLSPTVLLTAQLTIHINTIDNTQFWLFVINHYFTLNMFQHHPATNFKITF